MAPAQAPATRVASAAPTAQSEGFFNSLARRVGLGGSADTTASAQPIPAKPKVIEAKRNEPPRLEASAPKAVAAAPKAADTKQAAAQPPLKPAVSDAQAATAFAAPAKDAVVAGAAPIVPANSFESRFSAFK
jgi:hypothetical protein